MADHPDDPTPDAPEASEPEAPDTAEGPAADETESPTGTAADTAEDDAPGAPSDETAEAEVAEEVTKPEANASDTEAAAASDDDAAAGPGDTEPQPGTGEDDEPEAAATDDTGTAGSGDGTGSRSDGGRGWPGWVVPAGVGLVAVVLVVLGLVVLSGDDDDPGGAEDEAAGEEEPDDGAVETTVGTTVPPVTTAAGTPTAGLLSEIEPVDSNSWEPAEDDVTIGGGAYAETVVSGPIGTCDDADSQTVTYELAGGYTRLEGIVGLVDGTTTGLTVEVGFEADGEQVWWKTFAEGESTRVQLDLTGAQELTVTAIGLFPGTSAEEGCVRAGYGDLTLR